ncbi:MULTISPECIES: hypothetical protein [unclassified Modestobacter]|uniref:hypothetical protein n=1 Tax=unclassified Modestobacter TaxID=2643866 RepID=UPI0022AAB25A|nr:MULTISPECIES: hypothetical protein [unclassified Modestobacter]MCZ2826055.1 hypothetical protein [Modestobacter sp. VKM Ac-2981]MCZ2852880.1 hypothetical protein [Modestobacter sp. VKM Ac-2982]
MTLNTWTTPPEPSSADPVDDELRRLAAAVRTLRDVAGPTTALEGLRVTVVWLVQEAAALTASQRRRAAAYLAEGLTIAEALSVAALDIPEADQ